MTRLLLQSDKYVVFDKATGEFFTGTRNRNQKWTKDMSKARIFDRVTDAKNSNAFNYKANAFSGNSCVTPVSINLYFLDVNYDQSQKEAV